MKPASFQDAGSVPGAGGLHRLPRAIVLVEELLGSGDARGTRGELRAVLAGDDLRGGRRGVKLVVVDVPPASDAVDVLMLMLVPAGAGVLRLALPLGQSRLLLHGQGD